MKRLVYHIEFTDFLGYSQNVKLINNGQFVILRYDKIFIPQNARNSKRENLILKSSPNLLLQEIRQIIRPQSRTSRPGFRPCRCAQWSTSIFSELSTPSVVFKVVTFIERRSARIRTASRNSLGVGGFLHRLHCSILQHSQPCACLKPKGHQTLLYSTFG
jgi:hypothetical protein